MHPNSPEAMWTALALGALEPGDALALLREAGPRGPMRLATTRILLGLDLAPAPPAWFRAARRLHPCPGPARPPRGKPALAAG